MIQINLFTNRNRLSDIEKKLIVTKEEEKEGINGKFRFNRYTLLYIRQINKDLLNSTGNYWYIEYLIITHNGK